MGRFAPITPEAAAHTAESLLAGAGKQAYVDIEIPGTGIAGKMRVLTRDESLTVKAEALALFKERGLVNRDGTIAAAALDDWRCEIAVRHLAVAVRESDDGGMLAPLEDWRDELTDEQISGPWDRYQDLRDRFDPLGDDSRPLTNDEIVIMRAASKKKDVVVLRSFGLHKLALFAITTAEEPASSPTPR